MKGRLKGLLKELLNHAYSDGRMDLPAPSPETEKLLVEPLYERPAPVVSAGHKGFVVQAREIGEGEGWFNVRSELVGHYQKSPHFDCRIIPVSPVDPQPDRVAELEAEIERLRDRLEYARNYVQSLVDHGESVHAAGLVRELDSALSGKEAQS